MRTAHQPVCPQLQVRYSAWCCWSINASSTGVIALQGVAPAMELLGKNSVKASSFRMTTVTLNIILCLLQPFTLPCPPRLSQGGGDKVSRVYFNRAIPFFKLLLLPYS